MCGIIGIIDPSGGSDLQTHVRTLCDRMFHRGPDGRGEFFQEGIGLAMRRLSIIDLAGGWQPLFSRDGDIVAFQNGEIYNHKELRAALITAGYSFKTHSDTEVLAHGYAEWGIEGLLKRVDGMYAIAIFDKRTQVLHLARDRFGEKPLFIAHKQGTFAYSSDLRTLASLPWVGSELDLTALDYYLALHFVPGSKCILKNVTRVLPGERVEVNTRTGTFSKHQYYQIDLTCQRRVSQEELLDALQKSVKLRLEADVPVGVFLSGGIDSSLVATLAANHHPAVATFSMGFESNEHDESAYAQLVANAIGSNHKHFTFDLNSFTSLVPAVAQALDEPLGDQAMLPLFWLCREARKHVTVVLAGEGADEIFGGYSYYAQFAARRSLVQRLKDIKRGRWRTSAPAPTSLTYSHIPCTPSGFPLLTTPHERARMLGQGEGVGDSRFESDLITWLKSSRSDLCRAQATDIATWLPDDLLVKFDRMAMAHSLEGRAPFLSPEVVQLGINLPDALKYDRDQSKVLLRRAASQILPASIVSRRKQGFVLPMKNWVKAWLDDHGGVENYLRSSTLPQLDNKELTHTIATDLAQGVHRERLIFAVIMLQEWHKSFQDSISRNDDGLRKAAI